MTPEDALIELLDRVAALQGKAALFTADELAQWPGETIAALKAQKLISKARPASSAVCPDCERECVMPVHTLLRESSNPASFIVCDKRSDINRVPVSTERLTQWRCSTDAVCGFVADSLGLRRSDKRAASSDLWEIGIATGDKRSQMLCLQTNGVLTLVAGNNAVPLAECVGYDDGAYSLDGAMIRQLVDASATADSRYTPTVHKREVRKHDTQAMYESWRKAYRELKRKRRNMSDVWYSQQIARMDIARDKSAETIRKNMKC